MKFAVCLVVAAATVAAQAETVKLLAKLEGHDVGSVVYSTEVAPDGTWTESEVSKLELGSNRIENTTKIRFSADGHALENDEKDTVNGEVREDVVIKFDSEKAVVTDKLSGESKTFTTPKDPPSLDPSDSWFIKVKPKIGDKALASSFSTEAGWHPTTVTYVSDKQFKLGDHMVNGHLLHHEHPKDSYEEIVDDHGLPLEIDLGGTSGLRFVRTPYTDL